MPQKPTRRRVLKGTGAAAAVSVGLAGCLGGDDDGNGDDSDSGDSEPSDDGDDEPEEWMPDDDMLLTVPFGEGGGTDTYARQIMPALGDELGVNIRIENLPSAGGMEAMGEALRGTPGEVITAYNPPSTPISYLILDPPFNLDDLIAHAIYVRGSPSYLVFGLAEHEFEGLEDLVDRYNDGEFESLGCQDVGGPTSVIALTLREEIDWDWGSMVNYGGSGPLSADLVAGNLAAGLPSSSGMAPVYADNQDILDPVAYLFSEGAKIEPLVDLDIDYLHEVYDVDVDSLTALNRIYLSPPETPENILNTLSDSTKVAIESDDVQDWAGDDWPLATGDEFGYWEEADELAKDVISTLEGTLDLEELRSEFG